jgi:hypothetical protein
MAMSFVDLVACSFKQHISDEECARLNAVACHCCPNCDGPITVGEDESAGVCTTCYYGSET